MKLDRCSAASVRPASSQPHHQGQEGPVQHCIVSVVHPLQGMIAPKRYQQVWHLLPIDQDAEARHALVEGDMYEQLLICVRLQVQTTVLAVALQP